MSRWLKQVASVIISFGIYSYLFNWKVAGILLGGIVWHEYGHLLTARYLGLKTKGLIIIPFIGGLSFIEGRYQKYSDQAMVALAGPIAGTILTILLYGVYLATGSALLGSAAYWMAIFNCFNLVPLVMLDGSQVVQTITFSINEKVGAIFLTVSYAIGIIALWFINPFLIIVVLLIGFEQVFGAWHRIKLINQGLGEALTALPEAMSIEQIVMVLTVYLLTITFLIVSIYLFHSSPITLSDLFVK
jgi:Zn-dependent protease